MQIIRSVVPFLSLIEVRPFPHHFTGPRRMGSSCIRQSCACIASISGSPCVFGVKLFLSFQEYLTTRNPILLPRNWYDYSPGMVKYRNCDPEMKWPKNRDLDAGESSVGEVVTKMKTSQHTSYFGSFHALSIVTIGLNELTGLREEANFITLLKTLLFNKCGYSIGALGCQGPEALKRKEREENQEVV